MIHHQTAVEYFKELVEGSLSRQRVRAGDLTEFYLANLLCRYVRVDASPQQADDGQPLALRFARALECGGSEHRARLRGVADFSLFVSGFFGDSLARQAVDVDYYRAFGEYAYGTLSHSEDDAFATVFAELSRKFVGFMDVLSDISDRTTLASAADALRLYEKWLRTGSHRDGQRLVERGIVPNRTIGRKFIQ